MARSHQVKFGGNRFNPNCNLPSNMMETSGSISILQEFKDEGLLDSIKTITRDRENKSEAIFEKFGIKDKQRHDPGHFRNNFKSIWGSFTIRTSKLLQSLPDTPHIPAPFFGLVTPYVYKKVTFREIFTRMEST